MAWPERLQAATGCMGRGKEEGQEPGTGKLLCQVGAGVSIVRVRIYVGNAFLTSPPGSSASWSRAMIFWMNSSKKNKTFACTLVWSKAFLWSVLIP